MRSLARLAAAPLIVAAAACSSGDAAPVDAALQRDLQLASTTSLTLAPIGSDSSMLLETAPKATETPAPRPRAAATGPRRVRSEAPTVAAAPTDDVAAGESAEDVLAVITQPVERSDAETAEVAEADADAGAALPRPVPVSTGGVDAGRGDSGRGGGLGGIFGGVVIRGGDIDDCRIEPRIGMRRPARGPTGGMAGGRWPVVNRGGTRTGGTTARRPGDWSTGRSNSGSGGSSSAARPGAWGRH